MTPTDTTQGNPGGGDAPKWADMFGIDPTFPADAISDPGPPCKGEPYEIDRAYTFTQRQVDEILMALYDRRIETERYLRSYQPTPIPIGHDPTCEHAGCGWNAARVAEREQGRVALQERLDDIEAALAVLQP